MLITNTINNNNNKPSLTQIKRNNEREITSNISSSLHMTPTSHSDLRFR